MKKVFLIGAGILVLLVVVLVATGSFKFSARIGGENNVPPKGGIAQETVVPEGWTKYVSGEFGYTILYPDGWNLKETNREARRDILIVAPKEAAFVRIFATKDSAVTSIQNVEAVIADYKTSFDSKPTELLKEFKSGIEGNLGRFAASGRMEVNGIVYQFLERGIISADGRVLIMRGAVDTTEENMTQAEFDAQVGTVKKIMDSFVL